MAIVELVDEEVEGLDIVVLVCMGEGVLSMDLKPMIGFLMLKTFCSQKDMRSSSRLCVLILIRFTQERCRKDIITK